MSIKAVIYFIDGATWDLLGDWIDSGKLPNFKKIKDNGAYGKLRSVFPPITHMAMPAFFTGKDPARLGLLSMSEIEAAMLVSDKFDGMYLWDKLSNAGYKSLVVDMPFTYPPKPFKGSLFTGFYTPQDAPNFAYPDSMTKKYPNYPKGGLELEEYIKDGFKLDNLLKQEFDITEDRFKVFLNELRCGEFDFGFFYLKATDILQHYFWNKKDELLKLFKLLDNQIESIFKILNIDNFIILSDHGFDSAPMQTFFINRWLEENGYLVWKKSYKNIIRKIIIYILQRNVTLSKKVYSFLRFLNNNNNNSDYKEKKNISNNKYEISNGIDISLSKAYAVGGALRGKGIIINKSIVKDSDLEEKIKKEIIDKLTNFKINEKKVVQFVKRGEYNNSPDLLFLQDPYFFVNDRYSSKVTARRITNSRATGHHLASMDGVFLWSGSNVLPGEKIGISLIDIYPTILALYNIGNVQVDGFVRNEIFKDNLNFSNKVNLAEDDLLDGIKY